MTDFHITFDFGLFPWLNDFIEIWTLFMFIVYLRSFKTYSHNIWYADDCYADASLGAHVSLAYAIDLRIIFVVE